MYVPEVFAEERTEVLFQAIREIGAGTVVSHGDSGLIATQVPIELAVNTEGVGYLRCHFTRPNPHCGVVASAREVLVIFQGPQAYVSPGWYPSKAETGRVVPTWNYATVHAYGRASTFGDPAKLRQHLTALTEHFERDAPTPWKLADAPNDFIDQLIGMIVGVEIEISRLEGKWKMSQNRPLADRKGVVEGLKRRARGQDEAVAAAVQAAMRE